jgi:hypothetical protein
MTKTLIVGQGLLPKKDLKILSKSVNKCGVQIVVINIQTHRSLYGALSKVWGNVEI